MTITKERAIEILNANAPKDDVRIGERYRYGAEDLLESLAAAGAFDAPKPAGVMTRADAVGMCQQALREYAEGFAGDEPHAGLCRRSALLHAIEKLPQLSATTALDRAGAFPSEATIAEIRSLSEDILEETWTGKETWRSLALRLATACRDAGLLKATGALV